MLGGMVSLCSLAMCLRTISEYRKRSLQTKRLYSHEISVAELQEADYHIGIARLVHRTDPLVPICTQRAFSFGETCVYGALRAGDDQIDHIQQYIQSRNIPVWYGFYNPLDLPSKRLYPELNGTPPMEPNNVGCRIVPFANVKSALDQLKTGDAPTFAIVSSDSPFDPTEPRSTCGWRIERFIADEVLRCRQGREFQDADDPNLLGLLGGRTGPISGAISITIDFGTRD
jgi:hypothetical protein